MDAARWTRCTGMDELARRIIVRASSRRSSLPTTLGSLAQAVDCPDSARVLEMLRWLVESRYVMVWKWHESQTDEWRPCVVPAEELEEDGLADGFQLKALPLAWRHLGGPGA